MGILPPARRVVCVVVALLAILLTTGVPYAQFNVFRARDPGVRSGPAGAGGPLAGLTAREFEFFQAGLADFSEEENVADGLGPRMNLNGCAGCHAQPTTGGTSPFVNPQVAFATQDGGINQFPSAAIFSGGYASPYGPVREVRFKFNPDGTRDGGVHNTATITGRTGASGCSLTLDDINGQLAAGNAIFRIPTPVFGAGLIEQIPDSVILANKAAYASAKSQLGIGGRANRYRPGRASGEPNNNGNDGTISRFGWKAQNKSLLLFSGEAYNVEMGISNELFQQEREEKASCQFAPVPNDVTDPEATTTPAGLSAIEKFAFFQRLLAPPTPSPDAPGGATSINNGRGLFTSAGCAACHTPTLTTGNSTVAALRNKPVNLFSDILLHNMGPGLADDILQGGAQGDEFRTAPLWGLGKRIFFLHDGRTDDLLEAIQAHRSPGNSKFGPSEANGVINNFNQLTERQKQDMLNFLRSL
jgi:CxxC motif-containing protein (DUF1111 family)